MAETDPTFPQLIPPLGDELWADDALAAVGTQVPDTPDLSQNMLVDEPQVYGRSPLFDFGAGSFSGSGGQVTMVDDLDSLKQWVQIVLNVARGAHPIYDDSIGLEGGWGDPPGSLIGDLTTDTAAQSHYMQAVFDALMVHDRVSDVTNFDFYVDPNDPENLLVEFEIHTDDGDVVPFAQTITQ